MTDKEKPVWIKVKALSDESYKIIKSVAQKYGLHTVCQEALCPNISECWSNKAATFLLMGDICTRNCRFCSVKSGIPDTVPDPDEPVNIAKAVNFLQLKYVILTSVDRDDLPDGGAGHFAKTITEIKQLNSQVEIEALIPDFNVKVESLEKVIKAKPDIIGHNIETVRKYSALVRDIKADYNKSLFMLKTIKEKDNNIQTKSAIQVGFGESDLEVEETLTDLRENDVDIVVIGQYLRPTKYQIPVAEYISLEKFEYYKIFAKSLGFKQVISSPLARSSYRQYVPE